MSDSSLDVNSLDVAEHDRLNGAIVDEVVELITEVTRADGVSPISEHVWLHVKHGGDEKDRHFLMRHNNTLVGYAHLDTTDVVAGPSAELTIHPDFRQRGFGTALARHVSAHTEGAPLRLWAHSLTDAASALATTMGMTEQRVLWQMRRSLRAELPAHSSIPGITIRRFRPGVDDAAVLAVNARAFVDLPDQGSWTLADLQMRCAESWFDPDGFLLAWHGEELAGFHWTKVHGAHGHGHEAIGEVYVVAVDPAFAGRGLGRTLTLLGLDHLRAQGLSQVMLYVDAANTSAVRLYESLGFAHWDTDVLYRSSPEG